MSRLVACGPLTAPGRRREGTPTSGVDLQGADLGGARVTNVEWAGATCPDGSVVGRGVGQVTIGEGHLSP
jgi:hypothetical protein